MARNKRKTVKDKDNFKKFRKEARKRWRNKRAAVKALKNLNKEVITAKNEPEESPSRELPGETACKNPELSNQSRSLSRVASIHIKEIDPSLIVRTEKFLGYGTFGNCYLAYYRDIVVAVKEFKSRKASLERLKKEVRHEAKMINQLEDHRGIPLLFGVVTKSEPLRLITKFHGQKDKSLTLQRATRKEKLYKPCWIAILKNILEALGHCCVRHTLCSHVCKMNIFNEYPQCFVPYRTDTYTHVAFYITTMEQREREWNPIIIDFGKARFASDPKPAMSLTVSQQQEYSKRYPHVAPEIVSGCGRQSVLSDIFSIAKIVLHV